MSRVFSKEVVLKTIKQGDPNFGRKPEYTRTEKCPCGAELEVALSDIHYEPLGRGPSTPGFTCPCCSQFVDVDPKPWAIPREGGWGRTGR
jgi:hypothetical protein